MIASEIAAAFENPKLFRQATTHRSVGNRNNERLEFLGDAMLGMVIASALYERLPDATEGDLSRQRARLVQGDTLATIADEIGLGAQLNLGEGERKSGGQRRKSILADALEAVIGATLLDRGQQAAIDLVTTLFASRLADLPPSATLLDAKTRLQEWLQGRGLALPQYELIEASGPDHAKVFKVRASAPPLGVKEASGPSRRKAEQAAAAAVLVLTDQHG